MFNKHLWVQYIAIAFIGVARSLINEIFIYPNNFAPAGIGGIGTMLQYVFGFKVGYFTLLVNIPLLIFAWRVLNKEYSQKTAVYVVFFSVGNIIFRSLDFTGIAFYAKDSGDAIMAALTAGVISSVEFSSCLRMGGSTGGTDIISAYINKKNPQYDMIWINFFINTLVAISSFFVYGRQYTPVILCILYIFTNSRLTDNIIKGTKIAVKFEVFTDKPEEMGKRLISELKHGCTMIQAEGMYSHSEKDMLICVVNKHQVVDFQKIINEFPGSFAVISSVTATYGNFKKIK